MAWVSHPTDECPPEEDAGDTRGLSRGSRQSPGCRRPRGPQRPPALCHSLEEGVTDTGWVPPAWRQPPAGPGTRDLGVLSCDWGDHALAAQEPGPWAGPLASDPTPRPGLPTRLPRHSDSLGVPRPGLWPRLWPGRATSPAGRDRARPGQWSSLPHSLSWTCKALPPWRVCQAGQTPPLRGHAQGHD